MYAFIVAGLCYVTLCTALSASRFLENAVYNVRGELNVSLNLITKYRYTFCLLRSYVLLFRC